MQPQALALNRPKQVRLSVPFYRPTVNPITLLALWIVIGFGVMALGGEWLAPYSYTEQNLSNPLQPPAWPHLFGTDQYGRDILSRVIVGCRSIVLLATASALLAVTIGAICGIGAAYFGGLLDELIMRTIDVLLCFPAMLLALLIISALGSALIYLILCVGVIFAPVIARVVRGAVLELKTREFIEAAQMIGATDLRIIRRELLPNLVNLLWVEITLYFGYAILLSSGLGFLGLGVQPPSPDWGAQISEGSNWLLAAPWLVLFPVGAISTLVIAINLLADGMMKTGRR